jgi:hypothetical protein
MHKIVEDVYARMKSGEFFSFSIIIIIIIINIGEHSRGVVNFYDMQHTL